MVPVNSSNHHNNMHVEFDVNRETQIISATVTGVMCLEKSGFYFAQLGMLLEQTGSTRVLIDMRSTILESSEMDMIRAFNIASFYERIGLHNGGRVASVVPDEDGRLFHTRNIASATQTKGIEYRVFTEIGSARSWLMES